MRKLELIDIICVYGSAITVPTDLHVKLKFCGLSLDRVFDTYTENDELDNSIMLMLPHTSTIGGTENVAYNHYGPPIKIYEGEGSLTNMNRDIKVTVKPDTNTITFYSLILNVEFIGG